MHAEEPGGEDHSWRFASETIPIPCNSQTPCNRRKLRVFEFHWLLSLGLLLSVGVD